MPTEGRFMVSLFYVDGKKPIYVMLCLQSFFCFFGFPLSLKNSFG